MALLLIFTFSFFACDQKSQSPPQSQNQLQQTSNEEKLEEVKVAQFAEFFLYMPLYLADGKGFFKDQGLSINIVSFGSPDGRTLLTFNNL